MTFKPSRVYVVIYQKLQGSKRYRATDTIKVEEKNAEPRVCRRFKTKFYRFFSLRYPSQFELGSWLMKYSSKTIFCSCAQVFPHRYSFFKKWSYKAQLRSRKRKIHLHFCKLVSVRKNCSAGGQENRWHPARCLFNMLIGVTRETEATKCAPAIICTLRKTGRFSAYW